MGRRKTAKHAQRGTGFDPEVLSLCRPTRGGGLYDCERNWKVGGMGDLWTRISGLGHRRVVKGMSHFSSRVERPESGHRLS
jgi:hypothetical protein